MSEIISINSIEEYDKKVTNSTGIVMLEKKSKEDQKKIELLQKE